MTAKPYRPQALPEYRNFLVDNKEVWINMVAASVIIGNGGMPDTATALPDVIAMGLDEGTVQFDRVDMIRDEIARSRLWWVGRDACDLVEAAAPSMPPATLTPDFIPDEFGFVCWERTLQGRDAQNEDNTVPVDFLSWARTYITAEQIPAVSMISWVHMEDLGIALPLGRSDWTIGEDTDHAPVMDEAAWPLADPGHYEAATASIIEDRRLLAALWQLSSQRSVFDAVEVEPDRATRRRLERRQQEAPSVRLVNLAARHRAAGDPESGSGESGREYTRRWIVEGHWRQQACGPRWSQHRPVWIHPHVKGPEDKPLVVPDSVKVWR